MVLKTFGSTNAGSLCVCAEYCVSSLILCFAFCLCSLACFVCLFVFVRDTDL